MGRQFSHLFSHDKDVMGGEVGAWLQTLTPAGYNGQGAINKLYYKKRFFLIL